MDPQVPKTGIVQQQTIQLLQIFPMKSLGLRLGSIHRDTVESIRGIAADSAVNVPFAAKVEPAQGCSENSSIGPRGQYAESDPYAAGVPAGSAAHAS